MAQRKKAKKTGKLYAFGRMLLSWFYLPVYRIHVLGRENVPEEGPVPVSYTHLVSLSSGRWGASFPAIMWSKVWHRSAVNCDSRFPNACVRDVYKRQL